MTRLLVDYLAERGFLKTALALAHAEGLCAEDLTEIELKTLLSSRLS